MDNYVVGECMSMCPLEEIKLRQREGLIHLLESKNPEAVKKTNRIADHDLMVKCYERSAAGKLIAGSSDIRPLPVLQKTILHLLNTIICDCRYPYIVIYNFIEDRLKAVRQDLILQNPDPSDSIQIWEPIVRFYAYSSYMLCDSESLDYDPLLNYKQLLECLKKLLNLYDACDYVNTSRFEIEAMYVLLNLGNKDALDRSLKLPSNLRHDIVLEAEKISLLWLVGNYYKVCQLSWNLPDLLLATTFASQLPIIRKFGLQVMNIAYSSKNLTYPLSKLAQTFIYDSINHVVEDCKYYNITVNDIHVEFYKGNFNCLQKPNKLKKLKEVNKRLKRKLLAELLL